MTTTPPNEASPAAAVPPKPFGYWVYVPAEQRGEFVHDLDEATDDLTNCACEVTELFAASSPAAPAGEPQPIDMVLHCPKCGRQHIDASEASPTNAGYPDDVWHNPPHRSHLCHGCGHIWRPADVPTNGVVAVKTKGKADGSIPAETTPQPEPAPRDLVLRITTAYEQGFGHAERSELSNPYGEGTPEYEAWDIGRDEGVNRLVPGDAGRFHPAAPQVVQGEVERLRAVLQRLCRSFPTDTDMLATGWDGIEIEEACRAYDAAREAARAASQPKEPTNG